MPSDHDLMTASLSRRGHVQYESGHHGDTRLDLDHLFVDQRRLRLIANELGDRLRPDGTDVICGPLVGGALLGQWVASQLERPFVYAERVPQGFGSSLRYRIPDVLAGVVQGRRVTVVDDAINAGAATLATVTEIARLGGMATQAAAIFIRSPGGIELLEAHGLDVVHLVGVPFTIWPPADCPLCRAGIPVERSA